MLSGNSPFADKLDTNYVPSDPEMDQIRALLVEPTHQLARLDAQIDELEIVIEQLKVKRVALQSAINAHNALMAPVRRIPQDILGEIFFACLPTTHNALIDPGEAPMLLGRICKHWRSVAYLTPALWRSLHIPSLTWDWDWAQPMVPASRSLETKLEKLVSAWLDRSAAPLSISFSRGWGVLPVDSFDTIDHLIGVSRRIRHLRLNSSIGDMSPLLLLPPADLPCLKSISIKCNSEDSTSFWDGVSLFHAPSLQRVSFQASADALKLPLPWSQLTDLNLECFLDSEGWQNNWQGGLDLNGAQEVLRRCPHLVRCCLRATKSAPFVGGPTISLSRLTTLILYQEVDAVQLIPCLELPNLRYLGIGGNSPSVSSRAVEGSVHRLTLELLEGCRFGDNTLLTLLNLLPAISRIQAPQFYLNEPILDGLRPTPTGTLCPALTHMELSTCYFSDTALLSFIRERLTTDHPLRSIAAHFNRTMEVDLLHELHAPISEGLHLDLQYSDSFPRPWRLDARQGMYDVLWDV
ncbi:hypothetical protein FB451DRAFT_1283886 [Mycena latifolia]|nr:hypothetical protein FB451DRAFT_1283886 [Mycena latifolia]